MSNPITLRVHLYKVKGQLVGIHENIDGPELGGKDEGWIDVYIDPENLSENLSDAIDYRR